MPALRFPRFRRFALLPVLAALTVSGLSSPAWADRPNWAGRGEERRSASEGWKEDGSSEREYRGHHERDEMRHGRHEGFRFDDDQRRFIREYYVESTRHGHCPPGLAKKHDGCVPPGIAKRWVIGEPLPREIRIYTLPPALVRQLGDAPTGYRYVRVASDILMVAVGTHLVVDAIEDLAR